VRVRVRVCVCANIVAGQIVRSHPITSRRAGAAVCEAEAGEALKNTHTINTHTHYKHTHTTRVCGLVIPKHWPGDPKEGRSEQRSGPQYPHTTISWIVFSK